MTTEQEALKRSNHHRFILIYTFPKQKPKFQTDVLNIENSHFINSLRNKTKKMKFNSQKKNLC